MNTTAGCGGVGRRWGAVERQERFEDALRTAVSPVNFGLRIAGTAVHAHDGDPVRWHEREQRGDGIRQWGCRRSLLRDEFVRILEVHFACRTGALRRPHGETTH